MKLISVEAVLGDTVRLTPAGWQYSRGYCWDAVVHSSVASAQSHSWTFADVYQAF